LKERSRAKPNSEGHVRGHSNRLQAFEGQENPSNIPVDTAIQSLINDVKVITERDRRGFDVHANITPPQRYMNARVNSLAESMRQARERRVNRLARHDEEQVQVG
jgi:hypothetical protein